MISHIGLWPQSTSALNCKVHISTQLLKPCSSFKIIMQLHTVLYKKYYTYKANYQVAALLEFCAHVKLLAGSSTFDARGFCDVYG